MNKLWQQNTIEACLFLFLCSGAWRFAKEGGTVEKKVKGPLFDSGKAEKFCQGGSIAIFLWDPNSEGGQGPLVPMVQAPLFLWVGTIGDDFLLIWSTCSKHDHEPAQRKDPRDQNMASFLKTIDTVAETTRGDGFTAIKVTALSRPETLVGERTPDFVRCYARGIVTDFGRRLWRSLMSFPPIPNQNPSQI